MKVEISTTVTEWQVKEVEFPIYCHQQLEGEDGLDYSIHTKINKDRIYQIVWKINEITTRFGKVDNQRLSSHWFESLCSKEEWEETVKALNDHINDF